MIDRLVLELLQNGQVRREQFAPAAGRPGAVDLDAAGRALLIASYEAALQAPAPLPTGEQTALRRVLLLQAQAIARLVSGEQSAFTGYSL